MTKCPTCGNRIKFIKLVIACLAPKNVKFWVNCSCKEELKAKHWWLWLLFEVLLLIGFIYSVSNFDINTKLLVVIWISLGFVLTPLLLQFATFTRCYK